MEDTITAKKTTKEPKKLADLLDEINVAQSKTIVILEQYIMLLRENIDLKEKMSKIASE